LIREGEEEMLKSSLHKKKEIDEQSAPSSLSTITIKRRYSGK
jgi:hypothetical protein